jgi:hypothetical protein
MESDSHKVSVSLLFLSILLGLDSCAVFLYLPCLTAAVSGRLILSRISLNSFCSFLVFNGMTCSPLDFAIRQNLSHSSFETMEIVMLDLGLLVDMFKARVTLSAAN